jgi:Pentapeptide repeats (8 copies)
VICVYQSVPSEGMTERRNPHLRGFPCRRSMLPKMANPQDLARLRRGVGAWNVWRASGRSKSPIIPKMDFCGPDLARAKLRGIDLSDAYLVGVDLQFSDLRKAILNRANRRGAKLYGADLRGARMLWGDISQADLHDANLSGATLRGVDIRDSRFERTLLAGADLRGSDIRGCQFIGADLTRANLTNALLLSTTFADSMLRTTKGLESCFHEGPSYIDYHTFAKSGRLPVEFLRECGLSTGSLAHYRASSMHRLPCGASSATR